MDGITIIFEKIIELAVFFFEIFGVGVIIYHGIVGVKNLFKKQPVKADLTKGLALGLLFLLIGEILHSVTAGSIQDLVYIGLLVVIRMFIAHSLNKESEEKPSELRENKRDQA